jgi:Fibronectin type III domain
MATERVLVGGGTTYDPSLSGNSSYYYKFKFYDFYKYMPANTRLGNRNVFLPYGTERASSSYFSIYTNNLFSGLLPYQNPYDNNYYYNALGYWSVHVYNACDSNYTNPLTYLYFDFNFPVVLTKYRMWNGFANNIYAQNGNGFAASQNAPLSSNIGYDYPRDWILYGSNDWLTWTAVDARTSQTLSYATDRLCSNSPYSEYSISSPRAYKVYRLSVTKGSPNFLIYPPNVCNKSGCSCYIYYAFQIGEMQLLGYEDPSTSCSLHGYDKINKEFSYSGSINNNIFSLGSFVGQIPDGYTNLTITNINFKKSDVVTDRPETYKTNWGPFNSGTSQSVVASSGTIDTKIGYIISGYKIKGSSSGAVARLVFYGSVDNSYWIQLNDTNKFTLNSSNYTSFNFSNSYPFRYYKWNLYGAGYCDKGGCPQVTVNDIQIIGKPAQVGIPDMTSNTDPCGVASASDLAGPAYSIAFKNFIGAPVGYYFGKIFSAWNAFTDSRSSSSGYNVDSNIKRLNLPNYPYSFLDPVITWLSPNTTLSGPKYSNGVNIGYLIGGNSNSYLPTGTFETNSIDRYYLQYDFGKTTIIKGYIIRPAEDQYSISYNKCPVQWSFYGSNDGTNWTKIETRTIGSVTNGSNNNASYWKGSVLAGYNKSGAYYTTQYINKYFYLSNPVSYRMYRWRWELWQPAVQCGKAGCANYDTNYISVALSYIDVIPDNAAYNTVPDAPTNLAYSFDNGNSTVNLSWSKPVFTGYSPVLSYNITYCATDGTSTTINTSNTLYSFTNILLAGKTYKVSVSAVNKFGVGPETSVNISIPNFSSFAKIYVPVYNTPFDQNSTVTSRTIVVPNGATTLKAWACGDGRSAYFSNDGAGGLAWKTWNVSQNTSVNIQLGYNNCNQSGGESRVTYNGLTISGKPGSNGPNSLKYCSQSGGGTYSGGDGGANGAKGYGGAVGGNTAAYKNYNRYLMDPSKVSGLSSALAIATAGTTDKRSDGTNVFNYNASTTTCDWQPINSNSYGRIYFDKVGSGGDNGGKSYYINPGLGGAGSGSGSTLGIGFIVLQWS